MSAHEWDPDSNKLEREFVFKDFKEAMSFVNKIAELAEDEGHHPDIFLHNYNRIRVTLSTHSLGRVSDKDFKLAERIDELLK